MTNPDVDPVAVLAALGVDGAARMERVTGGTDTAIWRVERDGAIYALRVFRAEQARMREREVLAMQSAHAAGLPVPAIHASGFWQDRPALLLSWLTGRPLPDALKAQPWRFWSLAQAFGRMQARIHQVEAPAAFLKEPDAWMSWAGPVAPTLSARLRTLAPNPHTLLHLDYHPLNVLAGHGAISALLDWGNARAGDPRADVARTRSILRLVPAPGAAGPLLRGLQRLLERGWWRGYQAVAGPPQEMAPFYAWAGSALIADLSPKLGQFGNWLRPQHLDGMQRWTAFWMARAGLR